MNICFIDTVAVLDDWMRGGDCGVFLLDGRNLQIFVI